MPLPDPDAWGITPGYHDVTGRWVESSPRGIEAALAAMHAEGEPPPTGAIVVDQHHAGHLPAGVIQTEDGGTLEAGAPLPLGYHWLDVRDGPPVRLIVSPGRCPLPDRVWGLAVQLYAARSRASWGIGDLADLRTINAPLALINPLHAVAPTPEQQPSPYFPASRRWRNPLYLRIEDIPGAAGRLDIEELARAGRALSDTRVIDRDAVWRLKRAALEILWKAAPIDADGRAWIERQGPGLLSFATWSAIADDHGGDWRAWPSELQAYGTPMVTAWAAEHRDTVMFHAWLQWLLDQQLRAAAATKTIIGDLAIGADPGGADAWEWQDELASGVTTGAPPDDFNEHGQDWALPPFDPWRLRAAGYQPFIELVRAALAGIGGVRMDHVAGLFRLFWVPAEGGAREGVYVRYPSEDLLRIVALEAHRAGAFVVGEDLGTVEPEVRDALGAACILSYRVLWFADTPPSGWPARSLGAVTTHDLPTLAGVWHGSDGANFRDVVTSLVHDPAAPFGSVVERVYGALADSPSLVVLGSLEDALEVEERPNHPGTTNEWPNWSIALPSFLEDVSVRPIPR